ncbi:MAG: TolC family protein [Halobacteriovoraceae bacterium]|nr:TolC family protein [Halobacteriovoraceae bacterium]
MICLSLFSILYLLLSSNILAQDTDIDKTLSRKEIEMKSDSGQFIQQTSSQTFNPYSKTIRLKDVLEEGLRESYDQKIRDWQERKLDLNWRDTYLNYWYPKISLTFNTSTHSVGTLKPGGGETDDRSSIPSGSFGLAISDYTVFNWGKDYLNYQMSQLEFLRDKKEYNEERRSLKHDLFIRYFELDKIKRTEDHYKQKLRHATYMYRLMKEKVTARKINRRYFYQSRTEYLKAQRSYYEAKIARIQADESMAILLKDENNPSYIVIDELEFTKIRLALSEVLELAKNNNPEILEATKDLKVASKGHELALKENLPLPKFTVSLGAFKHSYNVGSVDSRYATSDSSTSGTSSLINDIDIVATLDSQWTLFGENGLLNKNLTEKALIDKKLAKHKLEYANHRAKTLLRQIYKTIINLQNRVLILEAQIANDEKSFNQLIDEFNDGKVSFQDYREALDFYIESLIEYDETKFEHFKYKIMLAKTIGIEDFPGENFENMAKSKKGLDLNK